MKSAVNIILQSLFRTIKHFIQSKEWVSNKCRLEHYKKFTLLFPECDVLIDSLICTETEASLISFRCRRFRCKRSNTFPRHYFSFSIHK
jgi:hypothetical protein